MKKIIAIIGFFGLLASGATTSSAAYFNPTPITPCDVQISQTLQLGSENNQVYILQTLLVNAGYLNAQPNGYFGNQTRAAVRAFQANNGIPATGIVGPSTRNAVNERLCDTDLLDNNISYTGGYGYGSANGTTYVSPQDPFVQVIQPPVVSPSVYANPGTSVVSTIANAITSSFSPVITPSVTTPIQSTNIIYSPSIGYTYGIVPQSGSINVTTPVANTIYHEGDSVNLTWSTSNLRPTAFSILVESQITGQSKIVATTPGNSYSFVLSKDLLDSLCSGTCNNNQQGSFRIVVSAPVVDIAGNTSTMRAVISPITIIRPLPAQSVYISTSKTPVNSGEVFKLYVNVPLANVWNAYQYGSYTFKIHAVCTSGVTVSIAGTPCGQDFSMPASQNNMQQEIPAVINNSSWYKQDVVFILTAINATGQTIGTGQTTVSVNAAPFNW